MIKNTPPVTSLDTASDLDLYGAKAVNLARLLSGALPVPQGIAIGLGSFSTSGKLHKDAAAIIKGLLSDDHIYAVRSSGQTEDNEKSSWAGQFETFLNVPVTEVLAKVEACHSSIKKRARAYAEHNDSVANDYKIAVVVQEMVAAQYAGVLFTKDPGNGSHKLIVEYVRGLGEALVHGDADPERIVWSRARKKILEQTEAVLPFPFHELAGLAEKVESLFAGVPQDIEWAYDGKQLWLVQSRPITTLQERGEGKHYLGNPGDLFYWGPSRAYPLFMSDFMRAARQFLTQTTLDPLLPDPPKTLVLFHDRKMVWLNKAAAFNTFVRDMFKRYEEADRLAQDRQHWHAAVETLDNYFAGTKELDIHIVSDLFEKCWQPTILAEFSLYGAEAVLHQRLARFNDRDRQEIWGGMTLPDQPTFVQRIDAELALSAKPAAIAVAYPWIQDGYNGTFNTAEKYFKERLRVVKKNVVTQFGSEKKRLAIIAGHRLTKHEIRTLGLARELSLFMDERKLWMMRTRTYIQRVAEQASSVLLAINLKAAYETTLEGLAAGTAEPYFGVTFLGGKSINLSRDDVSLAWDWYVEFRASHTVLRGIVASSGGRHFMNGDVFIAQSPEDAMPDNAVLVVPSTSPSYVPLMRKARALITDHGGMMSHAAIVAREFGLPCIVSTGRSTKILKNGDKVILDLVKGEINK
jgi:phosphohistidine swiveling domain-containing protein